MTKEERIEKLKLQIESLEDEAANVEGDREYYQDEAESCAFRIEEIQNEIASLEDEISEIESEEGEE